MEPDQIKNINHMPQGEPEEIPEELKAIDQRLKRVSDLQCFDGCSEELGEDELELVTAAGGSNPYKDFIKRINNKND